MKEVKDAEIRLFGQKIALPENGKVIPVMVATVESSEDVGDGVCSDENSSGSDCNHGMEGNLVSKVEEKEEEEEEEEEEEDDDDEEMEETDKDCLGGEEAESGEKDQNSMAEDSDNPNDLSDSDGNSKTTQAGEDSTTKNEKDQGDVANSQQKTLKKPDKIIPCPRCNSMDTKFCYYNNYNVNQPRHFCKSCQRYWTAGGTMRNVPVGAGRRKNKNSASNFQHISISEALQAAQIDIPNGYHHPTFNTKGTVLSFGSDSPLCDSMASVLKLAEKKMPNGTRNGYYNLEKGVSTPCKGGENGDDCSSGSSVITSGSMVDRGKNAAPEPVMQNINGMPSPIPCIPGVPWTFPWNPAVPMPTICPSGFLMPFYPAPYWNCSVPGPWNIPWLSPVSPTPTPKQSGSGPNSPALGKHSRDGELLRPNAPEGKQSPEPNKSGGSVLIPKTLRIDDPDEAAKSSIWATLGIKYGSVNRGGIFNALHSKADEKKHVPTPSPVLQANPAALSRALSLQETA